MGSVAKSDMTNGLLIYVKYLRISSYCILGSHMNFLIYEENFGFFFISVVLLYLYHNNNFYAPERPFMHLTVCC